MSISQKIKEYIQGVKPGEPFATTEFLCFGTRASVDKALSRLVKENAILRVASGVFVKPKQSQFVGYVMPEVSEVIQTIAATNNETIQVHGAEAARRFKLSTQVPTMPVFYTSGSTRRIRVGRREVKLIHTSNFKKLQHAGDKVGLALSALWYMGKGGTTSETIKKIRSGLSENEFESLCACKMPAWMQNTLSDSMDEAAHG